MAADTQRRLRKRFASLKYPARAARSGIGDCQAFGRAELDANGADRTQFCKRLFHRKLLTVDEQGRPPRNFAHDRLLSNWRNSD